MTKKRPSALQRCRVVWGETARIEGLPECRVVDAATYLPLQPDGSWGLFGPDGPIEMAGPAARPALVAEAPEAEYLYIGPLVTHYGHFLLSTVSRLWPLLAWTGERPRLLAHATGGAADARATDKLQEILGRFDLHPSDIVTFARPTRIRRLIVPAASLKEQAYAHDVYGDLARHVGRPFWDPARVDSAERPVYLSKARLASGIARISNEDALGDALAARGVDIVYPEELRFSALIGLLAERAMILGSAGSAFHTAAFSAPGRRIVGLNWASHLNANFPLLDGLNGTDAKYYHPVGAVSAPAEGFHFAWSVPDPEAVAVELLERAASFTRLDARDRAEEAARRRAARGPVLSRIGRWLSRRSPDGTH